jgi:hypothetical protein
LIRLKPAFGSLIPSGLGRYEVVYNESLHGNLNVDDLKNLIRIQMGGKDVLGITTTASIPLDGQKILREVVGNEEIVELEYTCRVMLDVGIQVGRRRRKKHSRTKRCTSGPPSGVSLFKYLRIRRSL